jgi:DNA ligase-1
MLLQYAINNKPFNKLNHVAELKLDGIRMVISNEDQPRIYTRHNNNVTSKYPELLDTPFDTGTVLDGELICVDENGKPDFSAAMRRFSSKKDKTPVCFCAFDIIKYKGTDVTKLPLYNRKELLDRSFRDSIHYKKIQPANGLPTDYYDVVAANELEGIVIKDMTSKYTIGKRSWSWQKVIHWTHADVFITGYRKKELGWLTSIVDGKGSLRPTGIIKLGITPQHKEYFYDKRKQLIYKEDKDFVYMEPSIMVRVKTRNWTKNGMLRDPVIVEMLR